MQDAQHLPGCDLQHTRRQRCSTWVATQPVEPGRAFESIAANAGKPKFEIDPTLRNVWARAKATLERRPIVISEAERSRERLAAAALIVHQAWFTLWMAAFITSGTIWCGGNDDCVGMHLFVWGMLWALGELLLAIPVVLAVLYLASQFVRGSRRLSLTGLGSFAIIPLALIIASILATLISHP